MSLINRACAEVGLSSAGARILHHYNNAVVHLPAADAVAKITAGPEALDDARRSRAALQWLIAVHGYPATEPLDEVPPVGLDNTAVTFWNYYPQPEVTPSLSSYDLALLLRRLHDLEAPPLELPPWEPLDSLHEAIRNTATTSLDAGERDWIDSRIREVRDQLKQLTWPLGVGLIHGDAWAGNLLWDAQHGRPILCDWDRMCIGPREVDLIPTWHAATRYGRGTPWARQFADTYGYDLATWEGYQPLLAMRDLVQLTGPIRRAEAAPQYRQALRQRLDSLRAGDTSTTWTAL
jgi:hypothetical protein